MTGESSLLAQGAFVLLIICCRGKHIMANALEVNMVQPAANIRCCLDRHQFRRYGTIPAISQANFCLESFALLDEHDKYTYDRRKIYLVCTRGFPIRLNSVNLSSQTCVRHGTRRADNRDCLRHKLYERLAITSKDGNARTSILAEISEPVYEKCVGCCTVCTKGFQNGQPGRNRVDCSIHWMRIRLEIERFFA